MRRTRIGLIAIAGLILLGGCNRDSGYGHVSGKVTVDGNPVTEGIITFVPENGPAAVGFIGADGTYHLTTLKKDGVIVGQHRVTIHATRLGPRANAAPTSIEDEVKSGASGATEKVEWIVPERYSQLSTTDLTATVNPEQQTLNFDLPGK